MTGKTRWLLTILLVAHLPSPGNCAEPRDSLLAGMSRCQDKNGEFLNHGPCPKGTTAVQPLGSTTSRSPTIDAVPPKPSNQGCKLPFLALGLSLFLPGLARLLAPRGVPRRTRQILSATGGLLWAFPGVAFAHAAGVATLSAIIGHFAARDSFAPALLAFPFALVAGFGILVLFVAAGAFLTWKMTQPINGVRLD